MASLSGKVALVTGSGRGIGREIALRLARDGASVIAHYSGSREGAEQVVEEIRASVCQFEGRRDRGKRTA